MANNLISVKTTLLAHSLQNSSFNGRSSCSHSYAPCRPEKKNPPDHSKHKLCASYRCVWKYLLQLSSGKKKRVALCYLNIESVWKMTTYQLANHNGLSLLLRLHWKTKILVTKKLEVKKKSFHLDHTFWKVLSYTYIAQCTIMQR